MKPQYIGGNTPSYLVINKENHTSDVYSIYDRGAHCATIYYKNGYFQWSRPHGKLGRKYLTFEAALQAIIKTEEKHGAKRCYERLLKALNVQENPQKLVLPGK